MVFRAINNDTAKLTDKLFLFKKSFTDIGKDLKNGIGIRGFTSIITSKDVRLLEDFNSSIKSGTNYTKAFDTYLSKVPISIKRQGNELIQLNNQMLKLNNSYKTGKITKQEYNAQMNALNGRVNNVIQSTRSLTVSERIATGVTKGLGVALKLAFNVGIGIAINLFVTAIYKLINAQKEYNEKTKELAEKIRQEKEEIKDLYKEYVDISKEYVVDKSKKEDLINITDDLLEKLGHEKTTIQELVDEYGNLDNAIQNITYENLKEKRGTLSNAKDVAENELKDKYKSIDKNLINNYENYIRANIGWSKFGNDIGEDFIDKYRKWYLKSFSVENAEEFIEDTNEFISRLEDVYYQSDLKKIKIYHALVDSRDELQKSLDEYNRSIDEVNKNEAEMAIAFARINKELPKTQEEFNAFKNNIIDTVLASDNLKKHFVGDEKEIERAITNVLKEMPEFTSFFAHDLSDSTNKNTLSVQKLTDEYEDLSEALEELISKQKKLEDVLAKVRVGISLTGEEVLELLSDFPDISEYIKPTADGYTVTVEGIKAANAELTKNLKETNGKNITDTQKSIQALKDLKQAAINMNNGGTDENGVFYSPGRKEDVDEYIRLLEETENIRKAFGVGTDLSNIDDALKELETSLNGYTVVEDIINKAFDGIVLDEAYDEAKSKIDDYNDTIKSLNDSITALGNSEKLNYDEMTALVDKIPELADFYEEQDGKYIFPVDKLEEWKDKTYDARNDYIDGLQEQLKAEEEIARNEVKAARAVVSVQEKFGNSEDKAKAQESLDYAENKLKKILGIGYKLSALREELTVDEDTDVSDELQNQIDKYNTIIDAIKIVRDQYSEAIDSEIEALEDSKDALKEANDERQREIDLREAIINLENAKKRKVWVFSNGGGFQQVQDKGAIKEAEEKYRDLITDIQEDAIDKQIEERKKLQDAWNEETDRITGAEQDIQDAMTIRQALKQLGLSSEKDLAALPESTLREFSDKLADAMVRKENEDNKENPEYKPVTLDDILKSMGATVTAEDLKAMKNELPTEAVYNAAVKGFSDSLKEFTEKAVNSSVVNNGGIVVSPTFNIYDANDPDNIAKVVNSEITNLLTRYNNSIK